MCKMAAKTKPSSTSTTSAASVKTTIKKAPMRISAPRSDATSRKDGTKPSKKATKKMGKASAKAASVEPKIDGRKSCVIAMKNVDENGSSVALTRNMCRDSREAVREMRGDWRFYSLVTFCVTFRACHGLPERTCAEFERALCDPSTSENDWLIE